MNQAQLLVHAGKSFADYPAISHGRKVIFNYAQLAQRVARLATALRGPFGLAPGERVALYQQNNPHYLEILYAIWHAGLAAVPINAKLHAKEFAFIVADSGAKVIFVTDKEANSLANADLDLAAGRQIINVATTEYADLFTAAPMPVAATKPDDLAWLFYTSGTTGRPKGAMLSQQNLQAAVLNYFADVDAIIPGDCMIHAAPLSHGSGLYALPHIAKAANNVMPASGGYDVAETLELIAHWPQCSFFFAPTMIKRLLQHPGVNRDSMRHLKTIIYGGAPMYVEDTLHALELLGPKLVQIYGQGEAPMTITGLAKWLHADKAHPNYHRRLGSVGTARTGVAVRVVDDQDRDLPVGEAGQIVCQGDVVMAGYWNNPAATAEALKGGWLHTGDVGAFDEEGFLTLKDRSKDVIISGGANIYPREVEEVLLRHEMVQECSVIGRPHSEWGEEVVAFVVTRADRQADSAALDAFCLAEIARFKRPKAYFFVDALPKNNYGKILKTELRRRLQDQSRPAT